MKRTFNFEPARTNKVNPRLHTAEAKEKAHIHAHKVKMDGYKHFTFGTTSTLYRDGYVRICVCV